MFRNVNTNSLLIKGHLEKSQSSAVNKDQASLILNDIFKDLGNPQSQAQYFKNQPQSSSHEASKKSSSSKDKQEKQEQSPPKNFMQLLNII